MTVAATDTLDGLAAKYGVNSDGHPRDERARRPEPRRRPGPRGPGCQGQGDPEAGFEARARTTRRLDRRTAAAAAATSRPRLRYTGGAFLWPVVGGGNYVSQYFHYGHYAIDIAADYGSTVRAAAAGTVTFAGWKSNGGGYQVWIAHGSGLYTTYNHMSAISVGRGEHVSRGEQVGRVGQSGNATGPHLHFEVWRGPVWDGGRRVNPLGYF